MALPYQADSLEGIDEAARGFYTEKNGKYVLDVEGVEPVESIQGLKSALAKERDAVNTYKKFGSPDEIADRIAALEAKQQKRKDDGKKPDADADALIDQLKADYEAKLADANGRFSRLLQRQASDALKAELAKAGVVPEGLDLLAVYGQGRIKIDDNGNVRVTTADGKPMLGSGADHHATLADLAAELAVQVPHLVADKGKPGGGTPGKNGGTPVNAKPLKEWTMPEKAAYIRENGLEAWNKKLQAQS